VVVFAPDAQHTQSEVISKNLTIERYPSKPWIPYPLTYVPKLSAAGWIGDRICHHQPHLIVSTDVDRFFLLGCWQTPGSQYAKQNRIPYVAEFHTDLYNFSATYPGWQWVPNFVKRVKLARFLYRSVDLTICPSTSAAETCTQIGIERIKLIPFYGIDSTQFSPEKRDRTFLNQWLSPTEQDHQVILFLGRLGLEKRVDLLIDAFEKLKEILPKSSLILAGDAPASVINALKQRAASIPHIHFTGFIVGEAKTKLFASCDVFCSPSPYETFGLTLTEAMASGLPVITVDSGAASENVSDRINGYLVPPNDDNAIAKTIQTVLTSDTRNIIDNGLKTAQRLSLSQGCQRLEQFYQELLIEPRLSMVNVNIGANHATNHAK
jgi:phosphatidylinositol alpha 1,6-mannosyltransferase